MKEKKHFKVAEIALGFYHCFQAFSDALFEVDSSFSIFRDNSFFIFFIFQYV